MDFRAEIKIGILLRDMPGNRFFFSDNGPLSRYVPYDDRRTISDGAPEVNQYQGLNHCQYHSKNGEANGNRSWAYIGDL